MIRARCHVCAALRPLDELLSVARKGHSVLVYVCKPGRTKTNCFRHVETSVGVRRVRSAMADIRPLMEEDR